MPPSELQYVTENSCISFEAHNSRKPITNVALLCYVILCFSSLYDDVTHTVSTVCHIHNERKKHKRNRYSCHERNHETRSATVSTIIKTKEFHLLQQTIETSNINFVVIRMKTMTSFWNMSNASAPIHITAASVK